MQLDELLEQRSIKEISHKTNISEENLEALFSEDFSALKRVKALGFISIIEREYKMDLSPLKKQAKAYYEEHGDDTEPVLKVSPFEDEKKKPPFIWIIALILLGLASWYFRTEFDKFKALIHLPTAQTVVASPEINETTQVIHKESTKKDTSYKVENRSLTEETVAEETIEKNSTNETIESEQ